MLIHSRINIIVVFGLSVLISIGIAHPAISSVSIGGELTKDAVGYGDLKVRKGRLTGEINNKTIRYFLESLSRLGYLEFKGNDGVLSHRISAKFNDVVYQDALAKVLDSFNYLIIAGQEDKPLYYVMGLRGDYVADRATITEGRKETDRLEKELLPNDKYKRETWGDLTGLSNEQREAFADGKKALAESRYDLNSGVKTNSEEQREAFANDQLKLQENQNKTQESIGVISSKQRKAFAADQKQINENQNQLNQNIGKITDQQRKIIESRDK